MTTTVGAPAAKTIDGIKVVAYMNTTNCIVYGKSEEVKCLAYETPRGEVCVCPGSEPAKTCGDNLFVVPSNGYGDTYSGPGIWIEEQQYLRLRLLGELP